MNVALAMSKKSKDPSTKVGAVLVRPDMKMASIGFNGFPKRMLDNPDYLSKPEFRDQKLKRMVHAEINAINLCETTATEGYHMIVTRHPCGQCALQIACTGITDVWYLEDEDYETRWSESVSDACQIFEETGITVHAVRL